MLKGYKTWIAVIGMALLGLYDLIEGNIDAAMTKFAGALGMLGIGHKIERLTK